MNAPARPHVDLQIATTDDCIPSEEAFTQWVGAALPVTQLNTELTVRIVGFDESQHLNITYREKDKPTNVLSFPSDLPTDLPSDLTKELETTLLGDLVICAPVVEQEAREQGKTLEAHWAHMVIHGTLHLLGYDHIDHKDATAMEALETDIITGLGYAPPYTNTQEEG